MTDTDLRLWNRVRELADSEVTHRAPAMKWMWGEALLGYALSELDAVTGEDRYLPFLKAYGDYWAGRNPRVDQADTCAPALITWALQKKTGDQRYQALTDKVLHYIRHEPRVVGEAVNHLGSSPEGRLYPRSVWVDSLMMFGLFPARYAAETGDLSLLELAARQPRLLAGYLQSPGGLWSHSYWVKRAKAFPEHRFWARGNGWVVCTLPLLLEYLPAQHPERGPLLAILERISTALLPLQRPDGYWNTLLGFDGRNYREASATALISAGWLRSVRHGWLGGEFREPAERAYRAVVASLRDEGGSRGPAPGVCPHHPASSVSNAGVPACPPGEQLLLWRRVCHFCSSGPP